MGYMLKSTSNSKLNDALLMKLSRAVTYLAAHMVHASFAG